MTRAPCIRRGLSLRTLCIDWQPSRLLSWTAKTVESLTPLLPLTGGLRPKRTFWLKILLVTVRFSLTFEKTLLLSVTYQRWRVGSCIGSFPSLPHAETWVDVSLVPVSRNPLACTPALVIPSGGRLPEPHNPFFVAHPGPTRLFVHLMDPHPTGDLFKLSEVVSFSAPEPESKPQPLKILFRNGKPCNELIENPVPTPLPAKVAQKLERKAATAKRLRRESAKVGNAICHLLLTYGANGKPSGYDPTPARNWSSLRPNEAYLNAYVSRRYGMGVDRTAECFDLEAYEQASLAAEPFNFEAHKEAHAAFDGWVPKPASDTTETGHWEPLSRQQTGAVDTNPVTYQGAPTTVTITKRMDNAGINEAYVRYAQNPEAEWGNFTTALLAFAPQNGRRNKCENLLAQRFSHLTKDDIIGGFALNLIERIKKEQYPKHDGRLHHWINVVWSRWFFPEVQTRFYQEMNHNVQVNEEDPDDEPNEGEERVPGLYRVDVERQIAQRDANFCGDSDEMWVKRKLKYLDGPDSKLSTPAKEMIRALAKGCSKAEAAEEAGVGPRQGRRLLKEVEACADDDSNVIPFISACADEDRTFDISASADEDFEPLLTALEAAQLLRCHEKTVQALARAGKIPCLRFGKYWRFRKSCLDAWVAAQIESDHQSRRAS
jgi:excisionase family DNA binding protein